MFLKQEPDESNEKNKHRLVEAMDSQTHHQFNLNPNKRIYISHDILMRLLHGNTDAESAVEKEAEVKSKTNKFLEFNIQKRKLTSKGRKLVKRLSLKNVLFGGGDGLSLDQSDLELAKEYSAIQRSLRKFMQTKIER